MLPVLIHIIAAVTSPALPSTEIQHRLSGAIPAQRYCGSSICGDIQNQTEYSPGQPAVGNPALSRGVRLDSLQWFPLILKVL